MADEPVEVEEVDEEEEPRLDPEIAARRAAAMTFIRRYGDPVLKSRATPVSMFDEALRSQVQRMGGLTHDARPAQGSDPHPARAGARRARPRSGLTAANRRIPASSVARGLAAATLPASLDCSVFAV